MNIITSQSIKFKCAYVVPTVLSDMLANTGGKATLQWYEYKLIATVRGESVDTASRNHNVVMTFEEFQTVLNKVIPHNALIAIREPSLRLEEETKLIDTFEECNFPVYYISGMPSAENLLQDLVHKFLIQLRNPKYKSVVLVDMKLYETPTSYVSWNVDS